MDKWIVYRTAFGDVLFDSEDRDAAFDYASRMSETGERLYATYVRDSVWIMTYVFELGANRPL